jgi:hypothetical protein
MVNDLEQLPSFTCVGLEAEGSLNEAREWIPRLWSEFWNRAGEIGHSLGDPVWGLMSDPEIHLAPWGGERGKYLAARQVPDGTLPEGDWKAWIIPEMAWLRLPCRADQIHATLEVARDFQKNNPDWRWGGAVHEYYPGTFKNPATDEFHLMVGLLPR